MRKTIASFVLIFGLMFAGFALLKKQIPLMKIMQWNRFCC